MHRLHWMFITGFWATAMLGCKREPKAGGECYPSDLDKVLVCETPTTGLKCDGHRLGRVPCGGPSGCVPGEPLGCDQSIANAGDWCPGSSGDKETGCTSDRTTTLFCSGGRLEVARMCRGPKGCTHDGTTVRCDQSRATAGDRCLRRGGGVVGGACSLDGKAVLECNDSDTFVLKRECFAKNGCEIGHFAGCDDCPAATCDDRGSAVGSRCGKGNEMREICSPDGRSILRCDKETLTFVQDRACKEPEKCRPYDGDTSTINGVVTCRK